MPEYLAPGVYVEEIELGAKPIEGVSTSTTGFVGVAQRGPVNRPVLVTNFGEYMRHFGGYLGERTYGARRWLPYAVDGFFANGGKRAYIVRVAKLTRAPGEPDAVPIAAVAQTVLPDRQDARRTLLRAARAGEQEIDLSYWAGLSVGDVLQLDDGDQAEYVQITGFTTRIQVSPALTRNHTAGVTVMQVSGPLTTLNLPPANSAGASNIRVADGAALTADTPYLIEDGSQSEIVQVGAVPGDAGEADVGVTPTLRFSHAPGRGLQEATVDGEVTTTLDADVVSGDTTIQLADQPDTVGLTPGSWVRLQGNAGVEDAEFVQLVGPLPTVAPFDVTVTPTLRFAHASGREVHLTTLEAAATTLVAPTSIRLAAAAGLTEGDVVMLEDGANTEFVQLETAPDVETFDVPVTFPLRFSHAAGVNVRRLDSPSGTTTLTAAAAQDDTTITVAARDGIEAGAVAELLDGAQTEYAQVVTSGAGAGDLTLLRPLRYPHPANTPVRLLQGTLRVIAGPSEPDPSLHPEVGEWGNDIRIQVESASIMRAEVTRAASVGDPALTLSTTQGIETGSVLRLPGNRYAAVTSVQGNRVFLQGGVPADITAAEQVITREFTIRFSYVGTDEVFDELSMDPRHSRYFSQIINGASRLVHVEDLTSTGTAPLNQPLTTSEWYPGGGDDALASIGAEVYVGSDADDADRRTGLFALLNRTDVSIVAVPGQTDPTVQLALISHAERARYRFAVLDSEENVDLDGVQVQRSLLDSKYAALYYPWIQIFDPLAKKLVFTPPSGHTCGIYARTDVEVGVHKAPANSVVTQARALQATVTQGQQDILNPKGINAIRAFPGRGIRVWGARTISSDPAWRYINVRRLFIFLEHSIDNATQYAVFEPNDVPLWERLRGSVTAFLTTQWRAGMLQGTTPDEAFFVKIGLGETMTQDDIDNGRVIMLIGVAPVKPAEFVIFRLTQMPRGSEVTE